MTEQNSISWKQSQGKWVSRRNLIRGAAGAAGAALGTGLLLPSRAFAGHQHDDKGFFRGPILRPIPGGVAPLTPFGTIVHHNPLPVALPMPGGVSTISDPSQVTDFDGFVGLTHINGEGTGTNTTTGANTPLSYRADMGFSQGTLIGTDGQVHKGTWVFV
jgi:hypothetical protein